MVWQMARHGQRLDCQSWQWYVNHCKSLQIGRELSYGKDWWECVYVCLWCQIIQIHWWHSRNRGGTVAMVLSFPCDCFNLMRRKWNGHCRRYLCYCTMPVAPNSCSCDDLVAGNLIMLFQRWVGSGVFVRCNLLECAVPCDQALRSRDNSASSNGVSDLASGTGKLWLEVFWPPHAWDTPFFYIAKLNELGSIALGSIGSEPPETIQVSGKVGAAGRQPLQVHDVFLN